MKHLMLAATAATAIAAPLAAKELTISTWNAPSHPTQWAGWEPMIPAITEATNGELTFKIVGGGALMGAKETLQGLGDGIADASILALTYHPSDLPTAQIVAELTMQSGDALAVSAAVTEFILTACEPCLAEFDANNVVYTGNYATAPYALISKEPITTPEGLKGKRVRTPGAAWDRFVTESGGTVVHTASAEMYEALDKGIIDVAMQPAASLKTYSLWDVASDITLGGYGVYNAGPLLSFNKDSWADLTPEERRAILDAIPEALIATTEGYLNQNEEAEEIAGEHGMEVIVAPEALETWLTEFNDRDVDTIIAQAGDTYGVENAGEIAGAYREILKKWTDRTKGGMGRDEIVATLKSEVFDQLDENAYGL